MNYRVPVTCNESPPCCSIRERTELKRNLQCHSFRWFLENVYPELKVPDVGDMAFGSIRQVGPRSPARPLTSLALL